MGTNNTNANTQVTIAQNDFSQACTDEGLDTGVATKLWVRMASYASGSTASSGQVSSTGSSWFSFSNLVWTVGSVLIMIAAAAFAAQAGQSYGDKGVFATFAFYTLITGIAGFSLWGSKSYSSFGGILTTLAVSLVPLTTATGLTAFFPQPNPDHIKLAFILEGATIGAGLLALTRVRFAFLLMPILIAGFAFSQTLGELWFKAGLFNTSNTSLPLNVLWTSLGYGLILIVGSLANDRRYNQDYSFWGYLIGTAAFAVPLFWLSAYHYHAWHIYAVVNAMLMLLAVALDRRIMVAAGGVGTLIYIGWLVGDFFLNKLHFGVALTLVAFCLFAIGGIYARYQNVIRACVLATLPQSLRARLPAVAG